MIDLTPDVYDSVSSNTNLTLGLFVLGIFLWIMLRPVD